MAANNDLQFQNTNRWSTKQLVTMALMGAIAILLSFIEFPIMPAASVGIVDAVAHAAIDGNWVGALMNSIVAIAFITPAAAIYKRNRTFKGAVTGMAISAVCLVVVAIVANLVIDPLFYGIPFDAVVQLIVPAILPFNIIKAIVVSILTGVVYKSISNLITPVKDQVKGR